MENLPRFEPNQPILLAEMQVSFDIDGRHVSAPAKILQRLWPKPEVVIDVSKVPRSPKPISQRPSTSGKLTVSTFPLTSQGPTVLKLEAGERVEVVPSSWFPEQHGDELHLLESPSIALDSGKPMKQLQFTVLNFTSNLLHWPLKLQASSWVVRIDPAPNLGQLEKELKSNGGFGVTNTGTIQRTDGKEFLASEVQNFIRGIDQFLSFLCGTQCASNNVVGFDDKGNEVWKRWGSYHVSPWQRHRTWSDITIRGEIPAIFEQFWQAYHKTGRQLNGIFDWYIYSNESGAIDVSIILNQVALESLTTFGSVKARKDGKLGNRIANMLQKHGIDPAIPRNCNELIALAKKYRLEHGPHALVKIRNSLVHPNPKLQLDTIDVYYEAKQLGLWYMELVLLNKFNYTGEYASRLTEVQRPGATEPVPWTRGMHNLP